MKNITSDQGNYNEGFKTHDSYCFLTIFSNFTKNRKECHRIFSMNFNCNYVIKSSVLIKLIKQSALKRRVSTILESAHIILSHLILEMLLRRVVIPS